MKKFKEFKQLELNEMLEINGGELSEVTHWLVSGAGWLYHGTASCLGIIWDGICDPNGYAPVP